MLQIVSSRDRDRGRAVFNNLLSKSKSESDMSASLNRLRYVLHDHQAPLTDANVIPVVMLNFFSDKGFEIGNAANANGFAGDFWAKWIAAVNAANHKFFIRFENHVMIVGTVIFADENRVNTFVDHLNPHDGNGFLISLQKDLFDDFLEAYLEDVASHHTLKAFMALECELMAMASRQIGYYMKP